MTACSLLMTYDSEYASLGDRETLVSYIISNNQSREMYFDFLGKFDFSLHYASDGSYTEFDSQPLRMN